jgi:hypothetical protein
VAATARWIAYGREDQVKRHNVRQAREGPAAAETAAAWGGQNQAKRDSIDLSTIDSRKL